ncbi:universal stress protein [Streptomyces griseobrunneus]
MSLRSEPPHGHVVVGTDGSRVATHALDQAAGEAHRRQVPLEIVHAWPWGGAYEPLDDDPQDILAKAAQHVTDRSPGLQVTTTAVPDDAAEVLVQRSRTAALTVVGTRGNGGFKGLLLGSVSLRVAAHCRSPLLIVRHEPAPQPISSPPTVVVGLRGEEDDPAAAFAFAEALRRNANLSIVHAWTYNRNDRTHGDRASRARQEELTAARVVKALHRENPFVQLDSRSVRGAPAQTLIDASTTSAVVVIAAHHRKSGLGLQLGPVTHALLHHASCHVALVPVMGLTDAEATSPQKHPEGPAQGHAEEADGLP